MPELAPSRPWFMESAPEAEPKSRRPGYMHNRRADAHVAERDLYLTPLKLWRWFWERFEPLEGSVIVDPATAGVNGWSAGGQWAAMHDREVELADLHPLSATCAATGTPIHQQDFLMEPPKTDGRRRTHLTNGPFKHYKAWWKKAMRECDEVILVVRAGFLATNKGRFRQGLHSYWQPAGRLAFELSPAEGQRRIRHNAELERAVRAGEMTPQKAKDETLDVVIDDDTVTGYRCSAAGTDHGIAVWRRGYGGLPAFMLEAYEIGNGQTTLFNVKRNRKRVSTDMRLVWR